jgi:hypothetical protein
MMRQGNLRISSIPVRDFFPFAVACYANRFRLAPEMVQTPPAAEPAPQPVPELEPAPIPE